MLIIFEESRMFILNLAKGKNEVVAELSAESLQIEDIYPQTLFKLYLHPTFQAILVDNE